MKPVMASSSNMNPLIVFKGSPKAFAKILWSYHQSEVQSPTWDFSHSWGFRDRSHPSEFEADESPIWIYLYDGMDVIRQIVEFRVQKWERGKSLVFVDDPKSSPMVRSKHWGELSVHLKGMGLIEPKPTGTVVLYDTKSQEETEKCKKYGIPTTKKFREKWIQAYGIIKKMQEEYKILFFDKETKTSKLDIRGIRVRLVNEMEFERDDKTIRNIRNAGNAGCLDAYEVDPEEDYEEYYKEDW